MPTHGPDGREQPEPKGVGEPKDKEPPQATKLIFRILRCVIYTIMLTHIKQVPWWLTWWASVMMWLKIFFGPGFDPMWPPHRAYTTPKLNPDEEAAWKVPGHMSYCMERLRTTGDKMQIFVQSFVPKGGKDKAKGVVAWVPPMNSYSGFHMDEITKIRDRGYIVCTIDQEGCGRSAGRHGSFFTYDDVAFDIVDFCTWARKQGGGLPLTVVGSSWGGTCGAMAALELDDPPAGLVLRNVLVNVNRSWVSKGGLLGFVLGGWSPMLPLMKAFGFSELPEEVKARALSDRKYYAGRMLVGTCIAFNMGISKLMDIVDDMEEEANFPLLVQHNEGDPVVPFSAIEHMTHVWNSKQKTLKKYKGSSHHLCYEGAAVCDRAFDDMMDWVDKASAAAAKGGKVSAGR